MIVTAWNNGSHSTTGAGYGVKLDVGDRDRFFERDWKRIYLTLEGTSQPVEINVAKASFWSSTCRELISAEIGRWMIRNHLAPWPKGEPPKLSLECIEDNRFVLAKLTHS